MMTRYQQPAGPGSRHICGHRRCRFLGHLASLLGTAAFLALLMTLSALPGPGSHHAAPAWIIITGTAAMMASTVLRHWPHPRAGDPGIEAIADATRESKPAPGRAHSGERQGEPRQRTEPGQ